MTHDTPLNGWVNHQTQSVATYLITTHLHLCLNHRDKGNSYVDVVLDLRGQDITTTTDGVELWSAHIDVEALDNLLYEMV